MKRKRALKIGIVLVVIDTTITNFLLAYGFTKTIVISGGPITETVHRLGNLLAAVGWITLLIVGALWMFRCLQEKNKPREYPALGKLTSKASLLTAVEKKIVEGGLKNVRPF